ncbi:hypothetical protein VD0002_g880 [Verticillium dahliae]|uniref:Uncharacterized protein n=2 Tax=Verticillium dahliae TaxID=27337 RepID=G2WTI8_VERDV|nr:uncharacterized protein VDAG_01111 [Verticillium dahliae VdLs.17]KAF3348554.1 putative oxidoreductase C23D3.11 [Verticillium dahliae VDG2]KAH6701462.1 hypothetical protein EV126DRAFT_513610 [Verticillium dahliae]EGY17429.1 hypothetical protein VDAG_01111 [Verticillium dahliae VdLs.17]PNH35294.1 hypothetical protein BJF96_g1126 [Verticillium dahliae]PNH43295.1 hypothetical protein VD0004_g4137 [Verticillium dahliae]
MSSTPAADVIPASEIINKYAGTIEAAINCVEILKDFGECVITGDDTSDHLWNIEYKTPTSFPRVLGELRGVLEFVEELWQHQSLKEAGQMSSAESMDCNKERATSPSSNDNVSPTPLDSSPAKCGNNHGNSCAAAKETNVI